MVSRVAQYEQAAVDAAVREQFERLGIDGSVVRRGDRVLLKPNFIVPSPPEQCAQTHPAVIVAAAKAVLDLGGRPFVADSPAWSTVDDCIGRLGAAEPLRAMSVSWCDLDRPRRMQLPGWDGPRVAISRVALDADAIINLPKFKAHQQLGATFAVKNLFGAVSGKRKAIWHFRKGHSFEQFCGMLIGIYRLLSPVVSIVDGIVAMEGMGPIRGTPRPLGVLVGGRDPIACERVCCELVGFSPEDLPILRQARRMGFGRGDWEQIEVLGDEWREAICPDFEPAVQIPLRFSLGHVCRSVSKQALLVIRSALGRGRAW